MSYQNYFFLIEWRRTNVKYSENEQSGSPLPAHANGVSMKAGEICDYLIGGRDFT